MNVRAQVVDAWRQLAVFANALLGTFNVQYQLNATSPPGVAQPLNIGGSGTAHQLVLNTRTAPDAQSPSGTTTAPARLPTSASAGRSRRPKISRFRRWITNCTCLRQSAEQYKIQQRQLELAYLTIDSSLESLQAPTPPRRCPAGAAPAADGPAALTQQLLGAQRSLPTGAERPADDLDQLPRTRACNCIATSN